MNTILDAALDARVTIVDVNPSSPNGRFIGSPYYEHLPLSAKDALESGEILNKVETIAGH